MLLLQRYECRDICALYALDAERTRDSFNAAFTGAPRPEVIFAETRAPWDEDFDPDAPTKPHAVVLHNGERRLATIPWGLLPPGWNAPFDSISGANAAILLTNRSPAISRCLIPVSGYAEREPLAGQNRYYYVSPRGRPVMTIAALVLQWTSPGGFSPRRSCAIIATAANDFLRPYSKEMPALLASDQFDPWLIGTAGPKLLTSAPQEAFSVRRLLL